MKLAGGGGIYSQGEEAGCPIGPMPWESWKEAQISPFGVIPKSEQWPSGDSYWTSSSPQGIAV